MSGFSQPVLRWLLAVAVALVSGGVPRANAEPVQAAAESAWKGAPVGRIVSLAPSATEILYAIGAQDRVMGVSRQCDYPVAAKLKPKFGDFNRPDVHALDRAPPELVLFTEYVQSEDLNALQDAGIQSLILPARTVTDVVVAIRLLGDVTGHLDAARRLADDLAGGIDAVRDRVSRVLGEAFPSVYLEVDGPRRLYAVGSGSFMHDALGVAGGRNVFAKVSEAYLEVTGEEVVAEGPEVILIDHPFQYKVGVSKRPGWSEIPAVRDGRIYDSTDFDMILLNRPGPRIVRSLEEISRILHPEVWNAP